MQSKLFVLIRGDIPIPNQAVQAGHAVAEYCKKWQYYGNKDWNNEILVYVSVKNLFELEIWYRKIRMRDLDHAVFCEPDINDEMTAIACYTETNIFSRLKLWMEA
jgi:hypothetical protein